MNRRPSHITFVFPFERAWDGSMHDTSVVPDYEIASVLPMDCVAVSEE